MMSKKSPQLRFEGFTDDWEERKLGDVGDTFTGLTGKTKEDFGHGSAKFVTYVNVFQNPIATLDQLDAVEIDEKQNQVQKGDVFFTTSSETPEEVGMSSVWTYDTKNVYLNSFTFGYRPRVSFDLNYMASMLRSPSIRKKITFLAQGISRYNISKTKMLEIEIPAPNLSEQKKIGSFFKLLDDTIALHQRKLDLLKEQKKGYLQKMFPKNGAKVPELRFAGFADDWEERKLSDVANHRGGTAIEKYFDKDGVYKVISIGSYGLNSQYVDQNIRAISNKITDGRVVNSGELTMVLNDKTANGTIIGRSLLVEKDNEYVINQRTEIISPKENFDSNFAYTILNGPFREKVKRIVQGGTQIYVNYPAVSNLNLELPKIEEQQKIGSFFKQLDDTIALHQRKLDLLKEQKKGFLQKMFV
ncbi:restriction endonuclease subunit S [Enterococcus faecalis]|nr:restriction endonuclease subunit S [Enterococcus faecalis]